MIKRMIEWFFIGGLIRLLFRGLFFLIIAAVLFAALSGKSPMLGVAGFVHGAKSAVQSYNGTVNHGTGIIDTIKNNLDSAITSPASATTISDSTAQGQKVRASFSPSFSEDLIVGTIHNTSRHIDVAACSLANWRITHALERAAQRGVKVRVVLSAAGVSAERLAKHGVRVRVSTADPCARFMVFDARNVQAGSLHYSTLGTRQFSGNVVIIRNNPAIAATYLYAWNKMWKTAGALQ